MEAETKEATETIANEAARKSCASNNQAEAPTLEILVSSPSEYVEYAFEQMFQQVSDIKKRVELVIRKKVVLDLLNVELMARSSPMNVNDLIELTFALFSKAGLMRT